MKTKIQVSSESDKTDGYFMWRPKFKFRQNLTRPTGTLCEDQNSSFVRIWQERRVLYVKTKIQVLSKSDKNNGYFMWRPLYVYDNISLSYF